MAASAYTDTVQKVYIAYYGRAADPVGLAYWSKAIDDAGGSLSAIMASFGASAEATTLYGSLTNTAKVNALYQQNFGRDADFAGLMYYAGQLTAGTMTAASIAQNIFDGASGTDATVLANKLTVAKAYTAAIDTSGEVVAYSGTVAAASARTLLSTVDATTVTTGFDVATSIASIVTVAEATPATAGSSFTLTTAADVVAGGAGGDSISGTIGTSSTFSAGDAITGGAGTDTVTISSTGGTNTNAAVTMAGVEKVVVVDAATTSATFDALSWGALSTLGVHGSTGTQTTFNNVAGLVDLELISNVGSSDIVALNYSAAVVTGATDTQTISLNTAAQTLQLVGIETVTATTTGSASTLILTDSTGTDILATVNVSGSANLTLTGTGSTAIKTVSAADMTGKLTLDISASSANANTVTGGTGADTIDIGAVTSTDTVDGGAGADTLTIAAATTVANAVGVTNVETLSIVGASGTVSQDMDAFDATTISVGANSNNTITLSDLSVTQNTLSLVSNNSDGTGISAARKVDSLADAMTVNVGAAAAGVTVALLTTTNEETMTVNSSGGANVLTNWTAADLTSLTITGDKSFVVTNAIGGTPALATVDASGTTGATTINASGSTVAMTMTGGTGIDTMTGGASNDTLTGGAGNDVLDSGDGVNTINGGEGNDTLTGGTGIDTISGGAGIDTIAGGTGNDILTGGEGNDTFNFGTNGDLTNKDSIDGGAGTDTVALTNASAMTPVMTSIEQVDATISGAVAMNMSSVSGLTRLDIENGSHTTATVTGVASGTTVRLFDADGGDTIDTVAGATLTVDARILRTDDLVISDAVNVTLTTTSTTNADDFQAVALDTVDTKTLTLVGSTNAAADLDTGNITASDQVTSLTATSSTSGAAVIMGNMVDADSLTSVDVTATFGDITLGAIGGTGSAEALSTVNIAAKNAATATIGTLTADTSNSATDNAMTVTASAETSSTVALGTITNTYGAVTANISGAGTIDSTAVTADDITVAITGGGGTHAALSATDDIVITAANTAALIFSSLDNGATASGSMDITATGSAALTVTAIVASAGTMTVDGSGASGVIDITATNLTGVATLTGGTAADTLVGGAGADVIVGGAGNDSLTGAAGNDTLTGGDGADTLIMGGAGVDVMNGGAGNDTFTIATASNLTSADTLNGGAGTDTLGITLAGATVAPTTTSIETVNVTFGAAANGALSVGNVAGAANFVLDSSVGADTALTMVGVTDGSTVTFGGATAANNNDTDTATIDTVNGASINIVLNDDQPTANTNNGAITITDAVGVAVSQGSRQAAIFTGALLLDAADTTSFSLTGANSLAVTMGAVTGTAVLETFSLTSAASSAVVVGALATATALTTLNLTGTTGNVTMTTLGNTVSADLLANVNATATGGSTIAVGDLLADDATTAAGELVMTVAISAHDTSTVTFTSFNNEKGAINATITSDSSSSVNFGSLTTTDEINAASGTLDFTASVGTNAINASEMVVGTINLAVGAGSDTIIWNDTVNTLLTVSGFEAGTGGDILAVDLSTSGVLLDGNAVTIVAANAASIEELSAAETLAIAGNDNVLILVGEIYATAAQAEAAIEASGSRVITNVSNTTGEDILLVWSDGSSSYVGTYNYTTGGTIPVGALTTHVELTGVNASVSGTFVNGNFDFA